MYTPKCPQAHFHLFRHCTDDRLKMPPSAWHGRGAARKALYLGKGLDKSNFGIHSPGPMVYGAKSTIDHIPQHRPPPLSSAPDIDDPVASLIEAEPWCKCRTHVLDAAHDRMPRLSR